MFESVGFVEDLQSIVNPVAHFLVSLYFALCLLIRAHEVRALNVLQQRCQQRDGRCETSIGGHDLISLL